jgi:predicted HicB family RNase H-like nuclease
MEKTKQLLTLQLGSDLHKEIKLFAAKKNVSMKSIIEKAIKTYLEKNK